jgi:hypothetical protein
VGALRQPELGDETVLANVGPDVFDGPIDPRAAREFLADPRHHFTFHLDVEMRS